MSRNVYVEKSEPSQCETATPAIEETMRELDSCLDGLGSVLDTLEKRLQPVLLPENKPPGGSGEDHPVCSPLNTRLRSQIHTVQSIRRLVEDILSRLEV